MLSSDQQPSTSGSKNSLSCQASSQTRPGYAAVCHISTGHEPKTSKGMGLTTVGHNPSVWQDESPNR